MDGSAAAVVAVAGAADGGGAWEEFRNPKGDKLAARRESSRVARRGETYSLVVGNELTARVMFLLPWPAP